MKFMVHWKKKNKKVFESIYIKEEVQEKTYRK